MKTVRIGFFILGFGIILIDRFCFKGIIATVIMGYAFLQNAWDSFRDNKTPG